EMPFRAQAPLIRLYDEAEGRTKFIGTTCFFRNRPLLRTLLEQIDSHAAEINVLVHAASIGTDVYSFAVAWHLFFQGRKSPTLRCFATDISAKFLAQARQATFPAEILSGLSESERSFFERVDATTCRVAKSIRDCVEILAPASYVTF